MSVAPARMSLTNLETGEALDVQYNPTGVEVQLEAIYNRAKTPGASYEELQYSNTGNTRIPLDLVFDARASSSPNLDKVQGFLLALLYPPAQPLSVQKGAPPSVLLVWPNWIALVAKSPKIAIKATRFAPTGEPTYMQVKVELEEHRLTRLGSDRVRVKVLRRAA